MRDFNEITAFFIKEFDAEIGRISEQQPQNLYEPILYSLKMGGKRIRPSLLIFTYNLFKSDIDKALPLAIAIEMFHNFTLLHDDIMDKSVLRRNMETVHVKYSENTAILSGDAMSILSYEYLLKTENDNLKEILALFSKTALQVCEGQQFDMDFETSDKVNVQDYLKMIGLKTAVLLAASLKLGAILANAERDTSNTLYEIGYNLGIAFQLQDDYLDTYGDTALFGKNIGGDIYSNKKTFLLIHALEYANLQQKETLNYWIGFHNPSKQEKISAITSLYNELNIKEKTLSEIDKYFNRAKELIAQLPLSPPQKNALLSIANSMMNRNN
jgi:geranylgeranyl diphosphate synthase, type II